MAASGEVERLYNEARDVIKALAGLNETSLQLAAEDHFRKALLLASASFFEYRVCECILEFVREKTHGTILIENFVRNRAISRQYHSFFSWDASNANQFFALFGSDFEDAMIKKVRECPDLQAAVKAFLEMGNERNRLVHGNYATFPMEKTLDEIYLSYQKAAEFVDTLSGAMRDC